MGYIFFLPVRIEELVVLAGLYLAVRYSVGHLHVLWDIIIRFHYVEQCPVIKVDCSLSLILFLFLQGQCTLITVVCF